MTAREDPGASFEALRRDVRDWYRAEAERLAAAHAESGAVSGLDFAELVRRSQALLACEMMALLEAEAEPAMDAADLAQLERVAKAMEAQGKAVPESIAATLRKP